MPDTAGTVYGIYISSGAFGVQPFLWQMLMGGGEQCVLLSSRVQSW